MDAERKAYQIEIISMDIKKRITWWETEFGEEEEKVVYHVGGKVWQCQQRQALKRIIQKKSKFIFI